MSEFGMEETKRIYDETSKFVKELEFTPVSESPKEKIQFKFDQEDRVKVLDDAKNKKYAKLASNPTERIMNENVDSKSKKPFKFNTSRLSSSKKWSPVKVR